MPSAERPIHYSKEREPPPYCRAASFRDEQTSGVAYYQSQRLIFDHKECDLSVFRLQLNQIWHVAVLGDPPPPDMDLQLRTIFATGEPAALPSDILRVLQERRAEAIKRGPWIERHYRPGKRV